MNMVFKLEPATFEHFYDGGRLRAEFFGEYNPTPSDDFRSESWIWSTNAAVTPGRPNPPRKGFSKVIVPGHQNPLYLTDYLAAYPYVLLGTEHVEAHGSHLGVLLKVFNTGAKAHIPVHWHPTPNFAKKHLQSAAGKNEAWYILSTGDGPGQAWVGWRRKMTKEYLKELILESDTEALRDCMNEIELIPGMLLGIPAGVAHSIGSDVCVLEPQEPTDLSFCGEPKVFPITEEECHMNLGWDSALDSVDLNILCGDDFDDILCAQNIVYAEDQSIAEELVTDYYRPYFWFDRLTVVRRMNTNSGMSDNLYPHCITVVGGRGYIVVKGSENATIMMEAKKGDSFFVPHNVEYSLDNRGDGPFVITRCFSQGVYPTWVNVSPAKDN